MAEGSRSAKRASSPNWLASLMGAVFLISAGFVLGLVVGVVKEEPELVMGHLAGQSQEVLWSEQEARSMPDVAAPGPELAVPGPDAAASEVDFLGPPLVESLPLAAAEDVASRAGAAAVAETPPAAPVAAPSREDPQSMPRRGFSVQVGAFAESGPAERIAQDLRDKGYTVYVVPSADPQNGRWRVRVGPMPSRSDADQVAQQLKARERLPTWVLSEGG